MTVRQVSIQRPRRWDTPFSGDMTEEAVDRLLQLEPFCQMDPSAFPPRLSLRNILKNDCRINRYETGDIVIRQGDYGNSAFLILEGSALVSLRPLPPELLGRANPRPLSWWKTLVQCWNRPRVAEARPDSPNHAPQLGARGDGAETRVFVQDIPGTLDLDQTRRMTTGELFGELAALNRTPRSATVIAEGSAEMLEIRWQGLRDLLRRDSALREYVENLYRRNSLCGHLQQTPGLCNLSEATLQQVAGQTRFESFGNFEWNRQFQDIQQQDVARKISGEPVIAEEGEPADSLILIRNGFARLSRQHGDGHQTIAYLGKGHVYGLRELAHNWSSGEARPWSLSLRAVGYVDILRIPREIVYQQVLPQIPTDQLPPELGPAPMEAAGSPVPADRRRARRDQELETGLLEFLVENRFINGTEAMLIDLDRCTRCDDCIRACAATHDNNPRFVREGPRHGNWMVASACMHCADPVCMIGCPTGAISREQTDGNVTINDTTCIGCGTCANSCPYQNIRMVDIRDARGVPFVDEDRGKPVQKATKCDFCHQLPGGPACQSACPHDALFRIDLTSPLPLIQLTNST